MNESAPTTFLLLRGLTREERHWGTFCQRLRANRPSADRILLCDLPGVGAFHKESSPISIAKMSEHVHQQLRGELENERKVVLVGLSLGGMVALNYLTTHPTLFSSFIIINSSTASLSSVLERLRPRALPLVLRSLLTSNEADRERLILRLVSNKYPRNQSVLKKMIEIQKTAPVKRWTAIRQMIAAATFRPRFDQIKAPGLVLCSKQDRLVNAEASKKIAANLRIPCIEHPEAGHDLPLDAEGWTVEQINRFLS